MTRWLPNKPYPATKVVVKGGGGKRSEAEVVVTGGTWGETPGTPVADTTGEKEITIIESTITDQATLDVIAQAIAAALAASISSYENASEQITIEGVDDYDPGTFKPEDQVTITSPTTGLSGAYTVKRIERDMTDPNWVHLELTTRRVEMWELDEAYRRMIRDAVA